MQKNMNRRSFGQMACAGMITMLAGHAGGETATSSNFPLEKSNQESTKLDLESRWKKLDDAIRSWWNDDLHSADENAIRNDPTKTLLFLPFRYTSAGGSEQSFPSMYDWDTQFINLALLIHDRAEIVHSNILDQVSMIFRFGKVLNGNRTYYLTRSQPPLLAWSVGNYLATRNDNELALDAYANLERAYTNYWNGPDHATTTGLSTCRDSGDKSLSPALAAEAETGLDFTPIFGGDVRRCVPIHVNAALVRYAEVLGSLATGLGWREKASIWQREASLRAQRINKYCWDSSKGFYFEYDYVRKKRLPYYSLNAYWPLWAGIASREQARRVIDHLKRFDQPFGLTFTDKPYRSPHPEYGILQWAYPAAWPPEQIIVALALRRYGFQDEMRKISRRYIRNVVETWELTGRLWEKYNAVTGGNGVPFDRYPCQPLHGWSSASAVIVGRVAFGLDVTGECSQILQGSQ